MVIRATAVFLVLAMTSGAVPVLTVEVIWPEADAVVNDPAAGVTLPSMP